MWFFKYYNLLLKYFNITIDFTKEKKIWLWYLFKNTTIEIFYEKLKPKINGCI